jgi:hypothetical protein
MARRIKQQYKSYEDSGKRFMICQNSIPDGRWWKGHLCANWSEVTRDTTAVLCHRCVNRVTEPPTITPRYKPTGRPKGWQWMNEFVDTDGVVYHKGVEQVSLKGTLPVTVVKIQKKKRLTKKERESQKRALMAELYDLKKRLKKVTLKKDIKSLETQIRKHNRKLKIK